MISKFQKQVYREVKKIKKGETKSYGEIARKLKTSPRAIGQALKRNPFAPKVPCHRVIRSDGEIGGFEGKEFSRKKIQMLEKEGVKMKGTKILK